MNDLINVRDCTNTGYYPLNWNLFNNKYYQRKVKKIKTVKEKKIEVITIEEKLCDTSKIMYGIFANQIYYSMKKGWYDENGNLFITFSLEKLATILNKSRDTIIKCKRELEENGLIKILSADGKSDVFYIGKVKEKDEEEIKDFIDKTSIKKKIKTPYDNVEGTIKNAKSVEDFVKPDDNVDEKVVDDVEPNNYIYITNNITTTTDQEENLSKEINLEEKVSGEKSSSSSLIDFNFLKAYSGLSDATRHNILKIKPDMTKQEFEKKFQTVKIEYLKGTIKSFDAVLVKYIKGEWNIEIPINSDSQVVSGGEVEMKAVKRIVFDCLSYIQFGWSRKDLLDKLNRDTSGKSNFIREKATEMLIIELDKRNKN